MSEDQLYLTPKQHLEELILTGVSYVRKSAPFIFALEIGMPHSTFATVPCIMAYGALEYGILYARELYLQDNHRTLDNYK